MINQKFLSYCINDAYKNKEWAKSTIFDEQWLLIASDMSKEHLSQCLSKSVIEMALDSYFYRKMRAFAKGLIWGQTSFIDPQAKDKWEEITGQKIE